MSRSRATDLFKSIAQLVAFRILGQLNHVSLGPLGLEGDLSNFKCRAKTGQKKGGAQGAFQIGASSRESANSSWRHAFSALAMAS
jgi:hypothetical protein